MDLSKAFDTLPHELLGAKLKSYGADGKTTDLVHDYLANRRIFIINCYQTAIIINSGTVLSTLGWKYLPYTK